jgi:hypothetical protein
MPSTGKAEGQHVEVRYLMELPARAFEDRELGYREVAVDPEVSLDESDGVIHG